MRSGKVSHSRCRLPLARRVPYPISAVVVAVGDDGMSAVIVYRETAGEFCVCASKSPICCIRVQRLLPVGNHQPDDSKLY